MRNIYKMPRASAGGRFATIAITLVVLGLLGLVSHSHLTSEPAIAAAPAAVSADASTPTVYFPSQYQLHAGEPEPLPPTF
jgi:hypothetical protein